MHPFRAQQRCRQQPTRLRETVSPLRETVRKQAPSQASPREAAATLTRRTDQKTGARVASKSLAAKCLAPTGSTSPLSQPSGACKSSSRRPCRRSTHSRIRIPAMSQASRATSTTRPSRPRTSQPVGQGRGMSSQLAAVSSSAAGDRLRYQKAVHADDDRACLPELDWTRLKAGPVG